MLSIELMLEMGRRVQPGREFWRPDTAAMASAAASEAAYCLDAPDEIPAGGMYADELAGAPLPMLLTVERWTDPTGEG